MPNRNLISMALVLVAVVYAAVSQGNGPAYLPGYALFSLMLVSWMHNRANVRHLRVAVAKQAHGFAGSLLLIPFKMQNSWRQPKFGLLLETPSGGTATVGRVEKLAEGSLSLPPQSRGHYRLGSVTVATVFPLGVFRSAINQAVDCEYFIYPEPGGALPLPGSAGDNILQRHGRRVAGDDFGGLRNYLQGDSQRHVDWKAVARGMPMMVKQFEQNARDELWLDWESIPETDPEARLSQLVQWIILAERSAMTYGLRLPGVRIEPSQGEVHYHRCLRELAGWGKSPVRPA